MKRILVYIVCVGFILGVGWILGMISSLFLFAKEPEVPVAISWGDGKYGKKFYGAIVYVVPFKKIYSVRAKIYIGRHTGYYHDCEEIGSATSLEDAVDRFGKIEWDEKGLHIGTPEKGGFNMSQARIESHR